MNKQKILDVFDECGVDWELLDLDDGWQIVVTKHGGHVFGPFSDRFPEGIFWTPESLEHAETFKKLVDGRIWNIGGDRVWVSPEIQFNIKDRSRFRETLDTPKTIDPGEFSMSRDGDVVTLRQTLDLESFNTVTGTMHLEFARSILKAANPLRKLRCCQELMDGVSYCGFEQILDLEGHSEQDIFAESWDLLQIRPKGTLYMPMYTVERGTDHYEPAGAHEFCVDSGVCLRITGDSRYKIAYKSACLTGRFGYLADSDTDESYLIVINYPNNPSCMYAEEPPLEAGERGYSIHIYNDDGKSGGFAEMECNMQTIGKPTGIYHAIDRLTKWIFVGNRRKLGEISKCLLGADMDKLHENGD